MSPFFKNSPLWLMRQAGRYLPEYREIRARYPDFMEFCWNPEVIAKVTLQPLDRFDLDAAILFSDILTLPHVLGQRVTFSPGMGPSLAPFSLDMLMLPDEDFLSVFDPIFSTIQKIRTRLDPLKFLIGFAGSPWTLTCYMISQKRESNFQKTLDYANQDPVAFEFVLERISHYIARLLVHQIHAGVDVLQIFDSWAGLVPSSLRTSWLVKPMEMILSQIRSEYPDIPIIYYGRGVSDIYPDLDHLWDKNVGFSVDENVSMKDLSKKLSATRLLQGNIHPESLVRGDFQTYARDLLESFKDRPYILNLGHGVLPQTPPEHVAQLVDLRKTFLSDS